MNKPLKAIEEIQVLLRREFHEIVVLSRTTPSIKLGGTYLLHQSERDTSTAAGKENQYKYGEK